MDSPYDSSPRTRCTGWPDRIRSGFTMVELLFSIGLIVLLAAILIPAVTSARAAATRAKCAAQLRQIGQALAAYATSNDGKYPDIGVEGNTFFNISYQSRRALGDGVVQPIFYCPTDDPSYKVGWDTPLPSGTTIPPTPGGPQPFITVGYVLLYTRGLGGAAGLPPIMLGPPTGSVPPHDPPIAPPDVFPMPRPQSLTTARATIPLACDPILSDNVGMNANFYPRTHMGNKRVASGQNFLVPIGQNVLYMDGHVQWVGLQYADVQSLSGGGGTRGDICPQARDQSPPQFQPGPPAPSGGYVYWYEWQKQQ